MAHQGSGKAARAAALVSGAARDPAAARSGILPAAAAVRPDLGVPARRAADSAGFFAPPRRPPSDELVSTRAGNSARRPTLSFFGRSLPWSSTGNMISFTSCWSC